MNTSLGNTLNSAQMYFKTTSFLVKERRSCETVKISHTRLLWIYLTANSWCGEPTWLLSSIMHRFVLISLNDLISEHFNCDCLCENHPYSHNNRNPIYSLTLKLHSCTVQAHQAY